jgi:hypothetical protein
MVVTTAPASGMPVNGIHDFLADQAVRQPDATAELTFWTATLRAGAATGTRGGPGGGPGGGGAANRAIDSPAVVAALTASEQPERGSPDSMLTMRRGGGGDA